MPVNYNGKLIGFTIEIPTTSISELLVDNDNEEKDRVIEAQEEQIDDLLDEIEEYEEEIEYLEHLVNEQCKALIDKDKYIEQLEGCIENKIEEIKEIAEILNLYEEMTYDPLGQLDYVIWKLKKEDIKDKEFVLRQLEEIKEYYNN